MGMEAARILALRGFDVKLYEKGDKLGGQLNEIRDPYKRAEFMRLVDYYERELKGLGVKVYLNTEFKDDGGNVIYAVPKERQPEFKDYRGGLRILLDSNLYAYQDYVFEWVRRNEVYVTDNVFRGLDRARAYLLMEKYRELGVEFVKSPESVKADVVIHSVYRDQPSIGKAIARGILAWEDLWSIEIIGNGSGTPPGSITSHMACHSSLNEEFNQGLKILNLGIASLGL